MSAFADIGYREDGPEDIAAVAGSVATPFTAAHVARPVPSVAHIRATPTGSAACAHLHALLHRFKTRTTSTRAVSCEAFFKARNLFGVKQ
jgi:hypothetical protein